MVKNIEGQESEFEKNLDVQAGGNKPQEGQELFGDVKDLTQESKLSKLESELSPSTTMEGSQMTKSVSEAGYTTEKLETALTKDIAKMNPVEKEEYIQILKEKLAEEGVQYPDREFFDGFRSVLSKVYGGENMKFDKLEMYRIMAQRPDLVKAITEVSQGGSFENFAQLKEFAGLVAGTKSAEMKDYYNKEKESGFWNQLTWATTDVDDFTRKQVTAYSDLMVQEYGKWVIDNKLYSGSMTDFNSEKVFTETAGK